jgi:hypothetical protein
MAFSPGTVTTPDLASLNVVSSHLTEVPYLLSVGGEVYRKRQQVID